METSDIGLMSAGSSGTLYFNPNEFDNHTKLISSVAGSRDREWLNSGTLSGVGAHEGGHLITYSLVKVERIFLSDFSESG